MQQFEYICCLSNDSIPAAFKICITQQTPPDLLADANMLDAWRPPAPYKLEFAKKIINGWQKMDGIYELLGENLQKNNFFYTSLDKIKIIFKFIDGEMWIDESPPLPSPTYTMCRNMKLCFADNQLIRHKVKGGDLWLGKYNLAHNIIEYDHKEYTSMSGFALAHYHAVGINRKTANGWRECEYNFNHEWLSTYKITC